MHDQSSFCGRHALKDAGYRLAWESIKIYPMHFSLANFQTHFRENWNMFSTTYLPLLSTLRNLFVITNTDKKQKLTLHYLLN